MRSASALLLGLVALGPAGCTTTQDVNRRYELRAERVLEGRKRLLVRTPTAAVAVRRVTLLRGHGGSAVVVALANRTGRTLTDLPVTVGAGRRVLNRQTGDYYRNHVAALAPHASLTWVFTTPRRVRGRAFARVGAGGTAKSLPHVTAVAAGAGRVRIRNASAVPQYALPVYALGVRGRRVVAAGTATLDELDGQASRTLGLRLTGDARGATLRLRALPTIFE